MNLTNFMHLPDTRLNEQMLAKGGIPIHTASKSPGFSTTTDPSRPYHSP